METVKYPGIRFNRHPGAARRGSWSAAIRVAGKQVYIFSNTNPRLSAYAFQFASELVHGERDTQAGDLGLTDEEKNLVEAKVRYRLGRYFAIHGVPK